MRHLFLTSSPFGEPGKPLNESNDFVSRLKSVDLIIFFFKFDLF